MNFLTVRPTRNVLNREIDNFFEDFFRFPIHRTQEDQDFAPRVDIREDENELALTFELPGMEKGDIKVVMVDDVLTVSGKREMKNESKNGNRIRSEISSGSFSRSFTLPDTVDTDKISADYNNGLLEVKMAKLEEVKPKEIDVKIK